MEIYLDTRAKWREWLEENHSSVDEVWLRFYKKGSGKPRIVYEDAVQEALCFGWIDGKIMRINDDYYIQRFTPRRKNSFWSETNIRRVELLTEKGLMKPEGHQAFENARRQPERVYRLHPDGTPEIPEDLLNALRENEPALANFNNFPPSAKKMYVFWLESAKRAETRFTRIKRITDFSKRNERPGML